MNFKRELLNIKINLVYKVLELFDDFFNKISKLSTNNIPLLLFKESYFVIFF